MTDLRIVTWNSTGEDAAKAALLQGFINSFSPPGAQFPTHQRVDVILIQEARGGAGGQIRTMLTALHAAGYTVHHCRENPGAGKGYICATLDATVTVNTPLQLWDYAADPNLATPVVVPGLGPAPKTVGHFAVHPDVLHRPPAVTVLTEIASGDVIELITWHAPRGISPLPIIVGTMAGGALLEGFLALSYSALVRNPGAAVAALPVPMGAVAAGAPDVVIIAGDLNATDLSHTYPAPPPGFEPLENFNGIGNHLDYVLAWAPPAAHTAINEDIGLPNGTVHDVLSARVNW